MIPKTNTMPRSVLNQSRLDVVRDDVAANSSAIGTNSSNISTNTTTATTALGTTVRCLVDANYGVLYEDDHVILRYDGSGGVRQPTFELKQLLWYDGGTFFIEDGASTGSASTVHVDSDDITSGVGVPMYFSDGYNASLGPSASVTSYGARSHCWLTPEGNTTAPSYTIDLFWGDPAGLGYGSVCIHVRVF